MHLLFSMTFLNTQLISFKKFLKLFTFVLFLLDYSEGLCPAVHPFMGISQRQASRSSPACIYQLSEEEVEKPLKDTFFSEDVQWKTPAGCILLCLCVCECGRNEISLSHCSIQITYQVISALIQ